MKIAHRAVLAVMGLFCSGNALAAVEEAALQLYGVVDAGLAVTKVSGQGTRSELLSGGMTDSLWGLQGTAPVGAGWQANFQLESGFEPSNGTVTDDGSLWNYGAWVGLAHARYGALRLGRQHTVGQAYGSELEIASWKDMGMGATFKASDNYQFSNMVNGYSPTWHGWQAGIGYSFDANEQGQFRTRQNSRAISMGLKYEKGPLLAVGTWESLRLAHATREARGRPQALQWGASYDFEVAKLSLAWSRQRNGYVGLNGGDPDGLGVGLGPAAFVRGGTIDAWLLGLSVPVGAGSVLAQWSLARPDWSWDNGASARNVQVATLGYTHDMSPRTTLYAFAGYATHDTLDQQFGAAKSRTTRIGSGISHRF